MMAAFPFSLAQRVRQSPLFAAFHYHNYRVYWLGLFGMTAGQNITLFTNLLVVNQMTGNSPAQAGLVGTCYAVGGIGFNMLGGAIADRVNRVRLVMATQGAWAVLSLVMGILALTDQLTVPFVMVSSFLAGSIAGFDQPTRQALVPQLVEERKHIASAVSMTSMVWQSMRFIGPAIAPYLFFRGPVLCYFFNAVAYAGMVVAVSRISVPKRAGVSLGLWQSTKQGLAYVFKSPVLAIVIGTVFVDAMFGASYVQMIPTFALSILNVDKHGVGLLMAFGGIGAFTGAVTAGWLGSRVRRKGLLFLFASIMFGIMLILFSHQTVFSHALLLTSMADFCTYMYSVTVQTQLQMMIPDQVRGRVMGLYTMVWSLQPLGSGLTGFIGSAYSLPFAISLGGAVVIAFALFGMIFVPNVRRLKAW